MRRYLRLYLYFLRFSFSRSLEFRLDFFFRVFMDAIFYAVNLAFFAVLYGHTDELGGWSFDETRIFVCGVFLVDAIYMTVFSNNHWWLPLFVNRGDLDYYLVRPVSSLWFLNVRDFAANSFLNLVLAGGLMAWALAAHDAPLGGARIVLYLLLLLVGTLLYALLRLAFILPVFWLHTSRGLDEVSWALARLSERPHQLYGFALRVVLVSVLPMALVASVPAHVLFEGLTVERLLHVTAVVVGLAGFVAWLWRRAVASYASASS